MIDSKTTLKYFATLAFVIAFCVSAFGFSQAAQNRGVGLIFKDRNGGVAGEYTGSRALLIGVSNYTAGWPDLESVPGELEEIEAALSSMGFSVEKVLDPDADQLKDAFEDFIDRYGFNPGDRLLFVFSGHGYTREEGRKGYLVPSDAPDPRRDETGFLRKALDMGQILSWARRIEAKHALFLFDSCFSGAIFKTRALPKIPPHIGDLTSKPVRQFITAGGAGEEVPARSVFAPSFVRALRGEGDINGDGYVTGTELGMHLHDKVVGYRTGQTPQYGKIRDPELDEGDFVFRVASSVGSLSGAVSGRTLRFAGYEWEILQGVWKVENGELLAGPAEENHLLLKTPSATDFTMEVTEEYLSGGRNFAVGHVWAATLFEGGAKRFKNGTSDMRGYGFNRTFESLFNLFIGLENGWFLIEPTWTSWQKSEHLSDKTLVKIVADDHLFKIYCNGILVARFSDRRQEGGGIALFVSKDLRVKFSDFNLEIR